MKPIITVEHLGKQYLIGKRKVAYATARDGLAQLFRATVARALRNQKKADRDAMSERKYLWALNDVCFEVAAGETVGIIGRNGAGKSTLLKILSRITEPTTGCVELYGRVASLLEVGTGFHPELTGRENIYMNGAILGMRRAEIKRNFDEIVQFAEIEKFLDTPVKHYSSGMYMRLAFAVAAHIEPEILIVDEVLSVGDAQFQKKCLGKMNEVARHGRTVLFVSHNMAAVANLCRRGVVLRDGQVQFVGTQTDAITEYLASTGDRRTPLRERTDRVGTGEVRLTGIEVTNSDGVALDAVASGQNIEIRFHYEADASRCPSNIVVGFIVTTQYDVPVFLQHNRLTGDCFGALPTAGAFVCRLPKLPLPPSRYRITCSVMRGDEYLDMVTDAGELTVVEGDFYSTGEVVPATHGCCLVAASWQLEPGMKIDAPAGALTSEGASTDGCNEDRCV